MTPGRDGSAKGAFLRPVFRLAAVKNIQRLRVGPQRRLDLHPVRCGDRSVRTAAGRLLRRAIASWGRKCPWTAIDATAGKRSFVGGTGTLGTIPALGRNIVSPDRKNPLQSVCVPLRCHPDRIPQRRMPGSRQALLAGQCRRAGDRGALTLGTTKPRGSESTPASAA
jgi:hypothetical protein